MRPQTLHSRGRWPVCQTPQGLGLLRHPAVPLASPRPHQSSVVPSTLAAGPDAPGLPSGGPHSVTPARTLLSSRPQLSRRSRSPGKFWTCRRAWWAVAKCNAPARNTQESVAVSARRIGRQPEGSLSSRRPVRKAGGGHTVLQLHREAQARPRRPAEAQRRVP